MKKENGIAILLWTLGAGLFIYAGLTPRDSSVITVVDSSGVQSVLDSALVVQSKDTSGLESGSGKKLDCVDVNTADEQGLSTLKGVGPVLAQRILQYRNENGPFSKKEDLLRVKGIGPAKMARMADQICF